MYDVKSANLIKYNANNRGTRTTDCVKRAISFAFDESYIRVSQELNQLQKDLGSWSYKIQEVYSKLIYSKGGEKEVRVKEEVTLNNFVDEHNTGTYIITTGDKPGTHNHLVCAVDGEVYDSWDSRNAYVYNYFFIPSTHSQKTDILTEMKDLAKQATNAIIAQIEKCKQKYSSWDSFVYAIDEHDAFVNNYNITVPFEVTLRSQGVKKSMSYDIVFVFTPTTTHDEALKIINNTAKVRVYDRLYELNKLIADKVEYTKSVEDTKGLEKVKYICEGREERFYNSLPGWVRGRIRYIDVDTPNAYSTSYKLRIYPINDEKHRVDDEYLDYSGAINFDGCNSSHVKNMLNRYKEKGEIPGRDYYKEDEE